MNSQQEGGAPAVELFEAKKDDLVESLHNLPRFGYSTTFADLVSKEDRPAYVHGLAALSIFISSFIVVWFLILIYLKLRCGVDRVGCAAGGGVVNASEMRKQKISRHDRRDRIIRNWRIQNVFLIASIGLSAMSFMFVNRGMFPFLESLTQVDDISNRLDSNAFIGIDSVEKLSSLHDELYEMTSVDFLQTYCPNYLNSNWAGIFDFQSLQDELMSSIRGTDFFIDSFVGEALSSLHQVTEVTDDVGGIVDWVYNNDWFVKAFLIVLNVINGFFFFGVVLTKNNVDYYAYQMIASYILLPLFSVFTICSLIATCVFVVIAAVNADFCSGGPGDGSPIGTFQDIAVKIGYNQSSPVIGALDYYASNCEGKNPFSLLVDVEQTVASAHRSISQLLLTLDDDNTQMIIQSECESNVTDAIISLSAVEENLEKIRGTVIIARSLTDCSNMAPIIRLVNQGMTCSESIQGATWMFFCAYGTVILGMILLTFRAALFNPLVRTKRRKRREREFLEYKDYMAQYYDTRDWEIDPPPTGLHQGLIKSLKTFDTSHTDETDESDLLSPRSAESYADSLAEKSRLETIIEMEGESVIGQPPGPTPAEETDNDDISYYSEDSEYDEDESVAISISSSVSAVLSAVSSSIKSLRERAQRHRLLEPNDEEEMALNDGTILSDHVDEPSKPVPVTEDDVSSTSGSIHTSLSDLVRKYFRTNEAKAEQETTGRQKFESTEAGKTRTLKEKESTVEHRKASATKVKKSRFTGSAVKETPRRSSPRSLLLRTPHLSRAKKGDSPTPRRPRYALSQEKVPSDGETPTQRRLNAPRKGLKTFARTSAGNKNL